MAEGEHQDPFNWDGSASAAPASDQRTAPPRRRVRRSVLAAGAGFAAAAGLAASLLLGGAGGGHLSAVLLDAANVTSRVPGFKFSLTANASAGSRSAALGAEGAFNTQPLNGSMSMTLDGAVLTERLVPPYAYVQLPGANGWNRVGIGSALSSPSITSNSFSGVDPQEMLAFLRSVGSVSTVGDGTIGGVATVHYHALVDVNRLAATLPRHGSAEASGLSALAHATAGAGLPLDVWIDAADRVRRLSMVLPITVGPTTAQFTLAMTLYDYGPQPQVTAPPADAVTNLPGSIVAP